MTKPPFWVQLILRFMNYKLKQSKYREITVLSGLEELSRAAAEKFVEIARQKINAGYMFTVALAGGSTPKRLYELLADENEPYRNALEWRKINFFWSDERCVPPDANESNFRMANETLLKPLGIPSTKFHRIKGELNPKQAAVDYEGFLRLIFNTPTGSLPRFDLILLGMGADGHTASLFPKSEALHSNGNLVAAPFVEKLGSHRLTFTPSVINHAENIIYLVAGSDKAPALHQVLEGDFDPETFPAQIVDPVSGNMFWFLDESAAELLTINRKYENFSGYLRR